MNEVEVKTIRDSAIANQPVLHLDGRYLRNSFESMAKSTEKLGGVESIVQALEGKSVLFQRTFANSGKDLQLKEFLDVCAFIPTVRRRLKLALEKEGFDYIKISVQQLLENATLQNADEKINRFVHRFPLDNSYRWTCDLAAEILHFCDPQTFPLMTRWIWDEKTKSGVMHEIWFHQYEIEHSHLPNGIKTHLVLRKEFEDFLKSAGVFAEEHFVIDLLCAWIYSAYIGTQGSSYLKTDFAQGDTSLAYTLRMLGLDGVTGDHGITRLLLSGGKRHVMSSTIDAVVH